MRLIITAGFNQSPAPLGLCELLRRQGHQITGIVVVSPFSIKRVRALVTQRGFGILKSGIRRMLGRSASKNGDALQSFLVENNITEKSLRQWSKKHQVPFTVVQDINAHTALMFLKANTQDAVIYAGGGILRKPFIEAAKRTIINLHCGPLPEIRGMNAIEWAVLLNAELAVTVHYIDEGIDTGDIIERRRISLSKGENIEELRAQAIIAGILTIVAQLHRSSSLDQLPRLQPISRSPSRQCYTMAPILKDLLQHKLNQI